MTDLKYNFLGDNFTVYEPVENPNVEIDYSLDKYDISNWAVSPTSSSGNPIVKRNNYPTVYYDNNEEYSNNNPVIQQFTQPTLKQSTQNNAFLVSNKNISLNKDLLKKALDLMNGLVNRNINPIIASGIVGNLIGESGYNLNTSAYNSNDVGAPAGGLAGWRGDNFKGLKKLAQSRGKKWTDLNTQLDYLVGTISKDVLNRLSKSTNPFEASEAWAYYEKYAGYNNSIETARKFLRELKWSDKKTLDWIEKQHKRRGEMSEYIYNLWLLS